MFSNLGLLMSLCWTLAFVAIYDSDDAFWYPFIIFNSLQVGAAFQSIGPLHKVSKKS